MFAPLRSLIASPNACCTCGFDVFRPFGVFTGSEESNAFFHGEDWAASARSQKRRKSMAPFEPRFSWRSQAARMSQALPTATGPLELGAFPPGKLRHMLT